MAYPDGITKEMVDDSAEEFVEKIKPIMPLLNSLVVELPKRVADSGLPRKEKSQKMVEMADEIGKLLAPHLVCKKGCSGCCNMAVVISRDEAEIIGEFTGKNVFTPPALMQQEDYVTKYNGVVCPFLKDDACSIYEVRPLPCRTHFNISKYPEVCDINKYPGCDTPTVDLRPFWFAAAMIHGLDTAYGDIREFFPDDMSGGGFE